MMTESDRVAVRDTYLFDGPTSRRGRNMNRLFMSLVSHEAREDFLSDERSYCRRYELSAAQESAIVDRDWQSMLDLGGSIFYIYKLAMMDGRSMQYLGGVFTGMTEQDFVAAMRSGGRTDV